MATKLESDVIYYSNTPGGKKAAEDVRRIFGGRQASAVVDQPLPEVQRPVPTFQPPPQYPPAAQGVRRQGTVVVNFIVGESGEVLEVAITSSPLLELNEAVIRAVKTWRFKPATRAGTPVRFLVITLLEFDPGR